jgi:hypothetical protein
LLADALQGGLEFATHNGKNKPMNMMAELLGAPDVQKGAERLSYGGSLTTGSGLNTRLHPEIGNALLALLPFAGSMGRGANYAAEGLNKGAAMIGKAAAPSTERLVNAVMAKGGLPAQLMQDMAQGTKSHIFIGQNAKNFDKNNLAQALKMEKEGIDPRQIWSETGSMKAPWDKQWRQEIDDSVANIPYSPDRSGRADMFVKHPELFDNYPSMSGMSFGVDSQSMKPLNGSYLAENDAITLGSGNTSTGLHELQHAIQGREGFASGGSSDSFKQTIPKNLKDVAFKRNMQEAIISRKLANNGVNIKDGEFLDFGKPKNIQLMQEMIVKNPELKVDFDNLNSLNQKLGKYALSPQAKYERLAGEAEARAVQARMNMDAGQRRATYPLDSFDVPVDQLITRFGDAPAMSQGNERLLKILERNGQSLP